MGRKFSGRAGSPFNKVPCAEAYLHTKWHLDASSRFATIEMGQKLGRGAPPLLGEGAGSPSNTVAWAEAYLHAKYHIDPFSRLATVNMGRKFGGGGLRPLLGRGAGPHLTQSRLGRGLGPWRVAS